MSPKLPLLAVLGALCLAGCAKKVDRFTLDRVVPRGLAVPDTGKACALGESLAHVLAGVTSPTHPPHRALVIAETTSALCAEDVAWEAELRGLRAAHDFDALGPEARAAEIRDAREAAARAHALAAERFYRSFQQASDQWGAIGQGSCPHIADRDQIAYLIGLVSGTLALLHDRAADGAVGVPLDIVGQVGRGAKCLDDDRWWHVPDALQAASWALIPGSGPPGVDPWARLETDADAGDKTGVRVARALQVLVASNADRTPDVEKGIRAFAASLQHTKQAPEYALLDEYARLLTLHQSDRLWTEAKGYRTPKLGQLPGDNEAAPPKSPLGKNVFSTDPFASPAPSPAPAPPAPGGHTP